MKNTTHEENFLSYQPTALDTILLVDDESNILTSLKRMLRNEGYTVLTAQSGSDALSIMAHQRVHLVVSDQRMPEMNGNEFLQHVKALYPECIRVILSGYADIHAVLDAVNQGEIYRFFTKPWNEADMKISLRNCLAQYHLVQENKNLLAEIKEKNSRLAEANQTLEAKVKDRTKQITKLNTQLEKSLMGSLDVLSHLSEMHSPVIGNHARRVSHLSQIIGERYGLRIDELRQLHIASLLHDIGKMTLPHQLLLKHESQQDKYEKEVLQQHVHSGEHLIRLIPNADQAALWVRHHHEWFNGNGYPEALKGKQIPIGSRIIALADYYDKCLHSDIQLNKTGLLMTPAQVITLIQHKASVQFDPELVAILSDYIQENEGVIEDKDAEIEIFAKDLRLNMVLAKDLLSDNGVLLLPKTHAMDEITLLRVKKYIESHPCTRGIFVYRWSIGL
ncbi:MAG: response regulator [Cyanobacteria bacterium]|nr:response regulator [Cyanobacteriota bacterium]